MSQDEFNKKYEELSNRYEKTKYDELLNLTEEESKSEFIKAYNLVMGDKEMMIQNTTEAINLLNDTTKLDEELTSTSDELTVIGEFVNKLVKENFKTNMSLDEFNKKNEELSNCCEKTKAKYDNLLKVRSYKKE